MPHTKSLIEKYKELVGAYKNYSDALMDGFNNDMGGAPYPEHWDGEIERITKELSLLQEQEKEPLLNSRCADCHELVGNNAAHICKSKTVTEMAKEAVGNMSKHKIRANKVFDFVVMHKTLIYQTTRFYGDFTSGKHDSKLHELIKLARKEIGYSDATWSGDIFNSLIKQYKSITIDGNYEPCLHPAKNLHGLNGVYYCDKCRESFSFSDTIPVDQSESVTSADTKTVISLSWKEYMRKQALTVIELTKGFTTTPTDTAMKHLLEFTDYILELTSVESVDQSGIREELIKFRDYLISEWKYEYVASICDGDIDEYMKAKER